MGNLYWRVFNLKKHKINRKVISDLYTEQPTPFNSTPGFFAIQINYGNMGGSSPPIAILKPLTRGHHSPNLHAILEHEISIAKTCAFHSIFNMYIANLKSHEYGVHSSIHLTLQTLYTEVGLENGYLLFTH